jgi:hypothetical protein
MKESRHGQERNTLFIPGKASLEVRPLEFLSIFLELHYKIMAGVQVIYGAGSAGSWGSEVDGPKVLDVLEELGVTNIDTARIYGPSEQLLGQRGAAAGLLHRHALLRKISLKLPRRASSY